jgi:3-dehydroquinate dehydratase-2
MIIKCKLIYILNGPNLNFLGKRNQGLYGSKSIDDVNRLCEEKAKKLNLNSDFRQTNHEGVLIDWIQEASLLAKGLIINPAAYSHTSIALYDALELLDIPIVEVHLSNIYAREEFRKISYAHKYASGIIMGFGVQSYVLAIEAMYNLLTQKQNAI